MAIARGATPDYKEPWESNGSHISKDQVIWGSRLGTPGLAMPFGGGDTPSITSANCATATPVVFDDRGIVTVVRHREAAKERGDPTAEQMADRICACVNALAGVRDPGPLIAELRAFLLDLCWRRATAEDPRLLNLMARLGDGGNGNGTVLGGVRR